MARDEHLAQELRSVEQRMAAETARAKSEVKELTQLKRRQAEETRKESRSDRLEARGRCERI